jgi:hypothetical protein
MIKFFTPIKLACLSFGFAIILAFSSCRKDESLNAVQPNDTIQPTDSTALLTFSFRNYIGQALLQYNQVYSDTSGRNFQLSDLRYYISQVVLTNDHGDDIALSNKVFLIDNQTEFYSAEKIATGNYTSIRFMIGLDSITNHFDPALYDASNPLSYQPNSMHWGWNFGYIFMKAEGNADTDPVPSGNLNGILSYHIGSDAFARVVTINDIALSVVPDKNNVLSIKFDFLKMLNQVDLSTENITHTNPGRALAEKLSDNWTTAFSIRP